MLGPEVPRTIHPGLEDFLPECDGNGYTYNPFSVAKK
jgi:hypothetical protein